MSYLRIGPVSVDSCQYHPKLADTNIFDSVDPIVNLGGKMFKQKIKEKKNLTSRLILDTKQAYYLGG